MKSAMDLLPYCKFFSVMRLNDYALLLLSRIVDASTTFSQTCIKQHHIKQSPCIKLLVV